jgi:membrane protease YdiL (CAAX protease family)
VLQLWLLLLATNGALALTGLFTDTSSPLFDVAVTLVDALIIGLFAWRDREGLRSWLTRSGVDDRTWWLPLAALAVVFVFMQAYFWVLIRFGAEMFGFLGDFIAHGWSPWAAIPLVCLAPAVFEELAFRGVIQGRLERLIQPTEALIVQAAMFSVLHMLPLVFVSHFVMGLVLGLVRTRTKSLYPAMAIHALWNGWVVLEEVVALGAGS